MALVREPGYKVSYSFRDNNDNVSNTSIKFSNNLTEVEVETYALALGNALSSVSNALLTGYVVSKDFTENAPVDPAPESEVQRKLLIPFITGIRNHGYSMEVPSPVFTIEQDGTEVVADTQALVAPIIELVVNGPSGFSNGAVTVANVQITGAGTPVGIHRNRRARK